MREKVVQDFKRDGATEKCLHDQKGVGSFVYIFLKGYSEKLLYRHQNFESRHLPIKTNKYSNFAVLLW